MAKTKGGRVVDAKMVRILGVVLSLWGVGVLLYLLQLDYGNVRTMLTGLSVLCFCISFPAIIKPKWLISPK